MGGQAEELNDDQREQRQLGRAALVFVAGAVGVASGAGAIMFWWIVTRLQGWFYGAQANALASAAAAAEWWQLVGLLGFGGLLIGVATHYLLPERRPHGVADVIEAAALRGGRLDLRTGFFAALASATSIGVGASVGREGPMVHLGATLGAWFARRLRIERAYARRLLACGVAAGVAASFNAPLAGVVFAVEVVVGKYTLHTFAPIIVASVAGTLVSRLYYGDVPAFSMPAHALTSYLEFPAFVLLGLIAALAAIAMLSGIATVQRAFERSGLARPLRPAVAGLMVGVLGTAFPQILGVGYEATSLALTDGLPFALVLALLAAKLLATSLSLGGGFSGGAFSPSLFIGAMTGAAFGIVVASLFPDQGSSTDVYALVGMGAVAGAVLGAPVSTTLIVFEMTANYTLSIAVMTAVVIASVVVNDAWGRTFFSWQLAQRGVDLSQRLSGEPLDTAK